MSSADNTRIRIEGHTAEANGPSLYYPVARDGPLLLLQSWPQHSHQRRAGTPALAEHFTGGRAGPARRRDRPSQQG